MRKHELVLVKTMAKRRNNVELIGQLKKVMGRIIGGGREARGWKVKAELDEPTQSKAGYQWVAKLALSCKPKRARSDESLDAEFASVQQIASASANSQKWLVKEVDGEKFDDRKADSHVKGYVPIDIPHNWKSFFKDMYKLDDPIDIIMSAVRAAINSNWQNRYNVALIGPPAAGKSDTLRCLKEMVGLDSVLEYDATSTTAAGAIKDLDERQELPRILIVEEIEKADDASRHWLLSLMDHRAEIRKVNFRQQIHKETRLLTFATINDETSFFTAMSGALASRFANRIYFRRPDRALLQQILEREIARTKGKRAWIKPALDYAMENNIFDPREVASICICGTDDLLTGVYQRKLLNCRKVPDVNTSRKMVQIVEAANNGRQ